MLMLILVCIILIIMLFFFYYLFNREILSPSFICTGVYLLSCFLVIFYCKEWGFEFELSTIAVIILALASVAAGECCAERIRIFSYKQIYYYCGSPVRTAHEDCEDLDVYDGIIVSRLVLIICLAFTAITALLYYRDIVSIVANSEYAQTEYGQTLSLLMLYNRAQTLEDSYVSYYVQHMFTFSGAIAAVLVYIILHNRILAKNVKNSWISYATVVVYIASSFLTSGRSKMLSFFIYIICLWLILRGKKKEWQYESNFKLLAKVVAIMGVAILLFYLAGFLTEKSLHYDNFFDNFANYFGSPIYNLNEYMKSPDSFGSSTKFFGIHTFSGIYSFLRRLGFKIPDSIVALEYIYCGNYLSNIYTPLRRYIQDFGIAGMALIMFLIGFCYKKLILRNKKENSSPLLAIYTAQFLFPLFFMSIEERVFMDVVLIRSVYIIIYIYVVYQWLVKKQLLWFKIKMG